MGDLFGGQFNSHDFYGLGDDPDTGLGPVNSNASWLDNAMTVATGSAQPVQFSPAPVYGPPEESFNEWLNRQPVTGPVYGPPADPDAPVDASGLNQWMRDVFSQVTGGSNLVPDAKTAFRVASPSTVPSIPNQIAATVSSAASDVGAAISSIFSTKPSAPVRPVLTKPSGPVAAPASYKPTLTAGQQSSFSQDLNSVVGTITGAVASIFGPTMARKQQTAATQAQRQPGARGNSGGKGAAGGAGKDDMTTYLYIGGGTLLLAGLVYMVAKD